MTRREKDEIERLPGKYRPIGAWGYFGYTILFSLPIIGQLCLLIFALSGSNINRRSFARMYFCGFFLALIIAVVVLIIILVASGAFKGGFDIANITESVKQFFTNLIDKIKGAVPSGCLHF